MLRLRLNRYTRYAERRLRISLKGSRSFRGDMHYWQAICIRNKLECENWIDDTKFRQAIRRQNIIRAIILRNKIRSRTEVINLLDKKILEYDLKFHPDIITKNLDSGLMIDQMLASYLNSKGQVNKHPSLKHIMIDNDNKQ